MENNSSQLFAPFRSLGVISNDIPFVLNRRGTENFVTLVSGKSFQIYHVFIKHFFNLIIDHYTIIYIK